VPCSHCDSNPAYITADASGFPRPLQASVLLVPEMLVCLKEDGNMFHIFERIILTTIYSPVEDNSIWETRYFNELYVIYMMNWT
jgi:hypothetical protein